MTIAEYLDTVKERLLTDEVAGFPHHVHTEQDRVASGESVSIFAVLDMVTRQLNS